MNCEDKECENLLIFVSCLLFDNFKIFAVCFCILILAEIKSNLI